MNKWLTVLILMLVFLPISYAIPMCKDSIRINSNCTMVTPSISCSSYSYQIFNVSENGMGALIENDSLTSFNGSIYYFTLIEPSGKYIINLCDGTTREVIVEPPSDNMVLGIIIAMPLLLAFLFMFIAHSLGDTHVALKITFMLLSLVSVFTAWQYGTIILVEDYGQTQLTDALAVSTQLYSYIFYAILTYFCIYIVVKVVNFTMQKKKDRFEY